MISYDIQEWGKPLQQSVREQPVPQGSEVLIRVKYCGICHSDVHIRDGYFDLGGGKKFHMSERGMKLPVTLGHENVGEVVAVEADGFTVVCADGRFRSDGARPDLQWIQPILHVA